VARPALELDPDEELRAYANVSFRGALAASARSTIALGSARMRQNIYAAWAHDAVDAGFPAAGPEMVLALTNRRIHVCRVSFWANRAAEVEGTLELDRIHAVATERHGLVVGLAFVFTNGHVVEIEAMRGGRVLRFARAVQNEIARR
jgi:hypothetical protein